jgi:hypothetical protein
MNTRPRVRHLLLLLASVFLITPGAAHAAGIYWISASQYGTIQSGSPDGSGSVSDLFSGESMHGLAVDPAAGKLYWTDPLFPSGFIRVGNLDGSGTPASLFSGQSAPVAVAIDHAAGKIYWANGAGTASSPIFVGNLDGSGSPDVLFDEPGYKAAIAVDPAAGKIVWTNGFMRAVRIGNLDGSGAPSDLYSGEEGVTGVAVDPTAGKVYWTNIGNDGYDYGAVRAGSINGSSPATTLFASEDRPTGIAASHALGKVYWGSSVPGPNPFETAGRGSIRVGNLDGSGYACNLYGGLDLPDYVVVDQSYAGSGPPECPPPDCPVVLHPATIPVNGPPLGGGPKSPGVRFRLQAAPPSKVDLTVRLRYRLRGHRRSVSFGRYTFGPERHTNTEDTAIEMRLPIPRKLRKALPINRGVTVLLEYQATPSHPAKCRTQSGEVRLKTRIKRVGLKNPITSR